MRITQNNRQKMAKAHASVNSMDFFLHVIAVTDITRSSRLY